MNLQRRNFAKGLALLPVASQGIGRQIGELMREIFAGKPTPVIDAPTEIITPDHPDWIGEERLFSIHDSTGKLEFRGFVKSYEIRRDVSYYTSIEKAGLLYAMDDYFMGTEVTMDILVSPPLPQ